MRVAVIVLVFASLASASDRFIGHPGLGNAGKIVGGEEAGENEFPWQISLQAYNGSGQGDHWCGGSIYSENHIVTAAHCVMDANAADLIVVAGDHDLFVESGNEQVRKVKSYVIHPEYNVIPYNSDIAVITLTEPLVFNLRIQPIRIAESTFEPSGKCMTTGWGNTRDDGSINNPAKLQKVELEVVPRGTCGDLYSGIVSVTTGMVCAAAGGKGGCSGDSGGPLVCKDESNRDYLAGIVSWGMIPCAQDGYPTVYTNVANYGSFVDSVASSRK